MRDVTFGQFYPVNSFVHNLDPRTKLLLTVAFMVAVFFITSYSGFVIMIVFLAMAIAASNVPLKSFLRSIKGILFLIIFTVVINLLFNNQGTPLFEFWIIKISVEGFKFAMLMALRLIILLMGSSVLTLTTTPVALTDALESLLKPLSIIKFPVHEMGLIMSIALKFIPDLIQETDRIIRAQSARGADFESRNLLSRAKAMVPILIPLLVSSFRRADELSYAMDARCYRGSKGRTRMKILRFGFVDLIAAITFVAFFMLMLADKYVLMGLF